jgi:hypothetical protein
MAVRRNRVAIQILYRVAGSCNHVIYPHAQTKCRICCLLVRFTATTIKFPGWVTTYTFQLSKVANYYDFVAPVLLLTESRGHIIGSLHHL